MKRTEKSRNCSFPYALKIICLYRVAHEKVKRNVICSIVVFETINNVRSVTIIAVKCGHVEHSFD